MSIERDLYRVLFDTTTSPMLMLAEERLVDANRSAVQLFGAALGELIGRRVAELSPAQQPDGQESVTAFREHLALAEEQQHTRFLWTYKDVNGGDSSMLTTLQRLDLPDGPAFAVTLKYVGGEANNTGRLNEDRYRAILENIEEGYFEVDLLGNHTFVNNGFCRMFGYEEHEIVGMSFREYTDRKTAARVFRVYHQVYETGEPVSSFEHPITGKRGEELYIQTSISLLRDQDDQPIGFRGFVRNVTEKRESERMLQEAHDNLEQRVVERTEELEQANSELKNLVSERERAETEIQMRHQSQEVLNALLQLSMEELSLKQQLERAFDLLLSTPWLSTLPAGSIFLVGDEPDVLKLIVQRGLARPLLTKCARVPFGTCLCGMSAARGETVFASCLDERHEHTYDNIEEHGHYNIPIKLDKEVVGVLNLYLEEGHERDEYEISFLESVANALASLIKRKRLEERLEKLLEQRTRQVRLSTQVSQEIASATDLSDLYRRVVTQVKEQFDYYHAQLLRYDPSLDTVALVVGYGEVGEKMLAMHHSIPLGVGLIGAAAKAGEAMLRSDVSQDPSWQSNPLLPYTRGELAVPIKMGDHVLGVLDVQSDIPGALNEEDQLLLEGLCGQIAVAIESTNLRQDMEARLRELSTLQQHMSREGWEAYQNQKRGKLGYHFGHAGVQPITLSIDNLPEEAPEPSDTYTNGKPASLGLLSGPNAVSNSLVVRGESVGALGIVDDPEQPLSEEDRELLAAVSQQVAEAMEMARLFEQTQLSLAEQERLTSEMETVAQVSTAASTLLDVDTLLQSVVDLTKSSFNLYHAHVYLLDESGERLMLRAGAGSVGRLMVLEGREIHISADSLVARAARDRLGFYENDVRKTLDFLPHPLLPNTRSELVAPMIVGDMLVGILDLQSDKANFFTDENLQTQRTLAAQIAVAVQNAFRYEGQVETAAKLRQVDQLKSEFLASMSHELRTPLNSIIGFADVLLEGLDGELNERMEEDVRLIRDSGAHLRSLIGDILDMSKIEAGRMELRYEEIDMRQMANDLVATAAPLAEEKKLSLFLDLDEELGAVMADRTRLRQIMWNIMGNAIKFTEEGHVTLSMQVKDNDVLVAIRDTGIGISEKNLPIVFEHFRQVDGSLNRKAGGTGLGMPITKNLVELHGGKIWVESVYGHGSTFWFTIPRNGQPELSKTSAGAAV